LLAFESFTKIKIITTYIMEFLKLFSFKYVVLLLLLISIETAAQYFLKKQVESNNSYINLLLGCLGYIGVGVVYYLFLTSKMKLTLANNVWNVGTAITVTLVGVLLFGEEVKLVNWEGLMLALLGVYFLSLR